jgi:hypothetical protein
VTSKREETVDQLTTILSEAPALTAIIGDILVRNMDFDDAQEAAMRLRRLVPGQALGVGPTQQEQQLTQQVQQLQAALTRAMQQSGKDAIRLAGKDQMRDIDVYEAETDRIKALAPMLPMDPQGLQELIQNLVADALETNILPILKENISEEAEGEAQAMPQPPIPGAEQGQDGEWYIQDPTRRTRYLRIGPLAQERTPPGTARAGS